MEIGPGRSWSSSAASTAPPSSPATTPSRCPALPLAEVRDPTGAGDSFAGGFLGFLDGLGAHQPSNAQLRQAMVMGSAMASFNVEDFGTERVRRLGRPEIDARVAAFKALTHF